MSHLVPRSTQVAAPRLRVGRAFTVPDPALVEADEAVLAEQREVNSGVRSTFDAVHSTLRSQGAAVRGLEEILKRMLPEMDRLADAEKAKATTEEVTKVVEDMRRIAEGANETAEKNKMVQAGLDGKFDAQLGQRALEALARQQHQAEQEAAAREAVGSEVVRLAASCTSFASMVEAIRVDTKKLEPRADALERHVEAAEARIAANQSDTDRRLAQKADNAVVEHLARSMAENAEEATRRLGKAEGETRKLHAEAMKAANEKMGRRDAQQALDALAEQIARQAHEHAQAGARLAEAMAARVERSEGAAATAQSNLQAELADARAELATQSSGLQLAIDEAAATARSQLDLHASEAQRESSALQSTATQHAERLDALASQLATVRADGASTAKEAAVLAVSSGRTAEDVAELSAVVAELQPEVERLGGRSKALGQTLEACTSQIQVCTERVESVEDRSSELQAELGALSARAPPLTANDLAPFEQRLNGLERALVSALEELRRRDLAAATKDAGMGLQRMAEAMRERLEQVRARDRPIATWPSPNCRLTRP